MQLRTRLNRDRLQSTSRGGFDRDQDLIQFCIVPERSVLDSDSNHTGVSSYTCCVFIMASSSSSKTSGGWSHDEAKTLVPIWGDSNVQSQLDGVSRNKHIYQKIAAQLADAGFNRS